MASKVLPVFFPPELSEQQEFEELEAGMGEGQGKAMRQLYLQRASLMTQDAALDRKLVAMVLDHAKRVVAHPSRPTVLRQDSFTRFPFGEIAIEETLEETPFLNEAHPDEVLVEYAEEKPFACVAMVDSSSSMSGEKHLLASIAVAVLLLEIHSRDASVIVFASKSQLIKTLGVEEALEATVLRFLKSQPRGFTNIELGLREGLKQFKRGGQKRKVGLIATDGRSTEGEDPIDAAKEYDFLVVLHLHGPGSHLESSQAIAQHGHGVCLEVEKFEELPRRIYEAVRLLARL